jgi:hypothetical protein
MYFTRIDSASFQSFKFNNITSSSYHLTEELHTEWWAMHGPLPKKYSFYIEFSPTAGYVSMDNKNGIVLKFQTL